MIDDCYVGDVRDGLRAMIAAGVRAQTCVTSPPYWGLRDYGTAEWDGGDGECDHLAPPRGGRNPETAAKQLTNGGTLNYQFEEQCGKCGATRVDRQIGLEPTIRGYVETMVEVFGLVRDVLADDGTLWLNLGDSYAGGGRGGNPDDSPFRKQATNRGSLVAPSPLGPGTKAKDLLGMPWRVAFALQADGWWLRQDIIWAKPNPMPESVTDRCTKSHEYLFLLAKRERYYFDADAISEPFAHPEMQEEAVRRKKAGELGTGRYMNESGRNDALSYTGGVGFASNAERRNKRSVWTVTTQPYTEAHFAVFPTALIEPCILAGSRPGDAVLDPFMGSGTVAQVAQDLGRRWIGCELNPDYIAMQRKRAAQLGMAF